LHCAKNGSDKAASAARVLGLGYGYFDDKMTENLANGQTTEAKEAERADTRSIEETAQQSKPPRIRSD
jgi:hypothetical protein